MFGSFSGVAGGNIAPSRFVKRTSSSGESIITQCGTNGDIAGISPQHTRRMALSGWDDGYAAISGENMSYIGPGDDEAMLEVGSGGLTAGCYIKSDTDGKGVIATTDKDHVGAIALHDAVAGALARVKPWRYDLAA